MTFGAFSVFDALDAQMKYVDRFQARAGVFRSFIKGIAQKKPYYFVMRDASMATDSVATNFEQIFATYSPDTVRKVL